MLGWTRWTLIAGVIGVVAVAPVICYRCTYSHSKRLREVTPGVIYRSGQMTADGFAEAKARYGIRTIINLQDEYPDPNLSKHCYGGGTIKESEVCKQLGVRYVYLPPDLIPRRQVPEHRPTAIDEFLKLVDDPATHPILLHCRAGLHRTGMMVAVYRMEYEGWSKRDVVREVKDNGFGEWPCSAANDYITQYILTYQRGLRGNNPGTEKLSEKGSDPLESTGSFPREARGLTPFRTASQSPPSPLRTKGD